MENTSDFNRNKGKKISIERKAKNKKIVTSSYCSIGKLDPLELPTKATIYR
jgi:hypothetical protein